MANRTRIQRDIHGQFVRADGVIFRPQPSCYDTAMPWADKATFADDEPVTVRHHNQTNEATVSMLTLKTATRKARWYGHGAYRGKQTEDCWMVTRPNFPRSKFIEIRTTNDEYEWVEHAAKLCGLDVDQYVRQAINVALQRQGVDAVLLKVEGE
jgi:hypothetical protein